MINKLDENGKIPKEQIDKAKAVRANMGLYEAINEMFIGYKVFHPDICNDETKINFMFWDSDRMSIMFDKTPGPFKGFKNWPQDGWKIYETKQTQFEASELPPVPFEEEAVKAVSWKEALVQMIVNDSKYYTICDSEVKYYYWDRKNSCVLREHKIIGSCLMNAEFDMDDEKFILYKEPKKKIVEKELKLKVGEEVLDILNLTHAGKRLDNLVNIIGVSNFEAVSETRIKHEIKISFTVEE